jgi:hypothetical protein
MRVMERSKTMSPKISTILSALLLMLATVPALADQADSVLFGQPFSKHAQLSPDERRALRERWEQASPEERIRMRQFFQDRMRQLPSPPLPPEARDAMRMPFPGAAQRDSGFGFGFEKRRAEEAQPERSMWPGSRRTNDDER